MKKYNIIYADPPWKYNDKMKVKGATGFIRGAESFYNTMDLKDIKELPIKNITDNNCYLFLWATMPLLQDAFEVIKAWGFEYKTMGFVWVKKTITGKNHFGMGHYTRGNAELCLLAIKGKLKRLTGSVRQIVESEIKRHSEKPEEVRKKIVELYGDIPRIELFARKNTKGWDVWGNEVKNNVNFNKEEL